MSEKNMAELRDVKRKTLLVALEKVLPGVATKDVVSHASLVTIRDGCWWAFNDEVAISTPAPKGMASWNIAFPGTGILGALESLGVKMVDLFLDEKQLTLTAGRVKVVVPVVESLLPVAKIELPLKWANLPEGFLDALHLAAFCVSTDMTYPIFTNALWSGDSLFACDRFRVIRCPVKVASKSDILIPSACFPIVHFAQPTQYGTTKGWLHFRTEDDTVMSCRLMQDVAYPLNKIQTLFDVEGARVAIPNEMLEAVLCSQHFTDVEFGHEESIDVELGPDGIVVKSSSARLGKFRELIPAALGLKKHIKFKVNPRLLLEAAKLSDTIIVGDKSLLIRSKQYEHVVSLIKED